MVWVFFPICIVFSLFVSHKILSVMLSSLVALGLTKKLSILVYILMKSVF